MCLEVLRDLVVTFRLEAWARLVEVVVPGSHG
jgi:hypothetical protein